jgi:hypothetical protein
VVGDQTYPRNNWLWFRIVVETFLRSVQGPWWAADIEADLALHDSFIRQDGWLSDGVGRSFDHYTGWALHLYPALWQRMRGATDLADEQRWQRDRELLDRYLLDAAHLVGADGGPLIQGRSLIYRSAAAAPFWAGALSQVPSTPPGLLRRAASGIVSHFAARGAPGPDGLLSLGWHHPWRALAQAYSGPGSPYWAAKGFLGLALPASHPVWTGVEEPLPVEQGDFVRPVNAPGWLAHARAADGIVQVVNHGTDHAAAGELVGDSPLYARLGYSSATAPLLDRAAWTAPLEQAVCLVDGAGRTTHRAGLELALIGSNAEVAWAASASQAHWLTPAAAQQHHGSGLTGQAEVAGRLTVFSLTRAAWEVRGAYLTDLRHPGQGAAGGSAGDNQPPCPPPAVSDHLGSAPPGAGQTGAGLKLRLGGWALAGPGENRATAGSGGTAQAAVCVGELTTAIADLTAPALGLRPEPGVAVRDEASPLANPVSVPYLDYPAVPGVWVWVLVSLVHAAPAGAAAALTINADAITVAWPDGQVTTTPLDSPPDLPALASASANQSGANHKVFTQPENKRGPRYPHEKDNP